MPHQHALLTNARKIRTTLWGGAPQHLVGPLFLYLSSLSINLPPPPYPRCEYQLYTALPAPSCSSCCVAECIALANVVRRWVFLTSLIYRYFSLSLFLHLSALSLSDYLFPLSTSTYESRTPTTTSYTTSTAHQIFYDYNDMCSHSH